MCGLRLIIIYASFLMFARQICKQKITVEYTTEATWYWLVAGLSSIVIDWPYLNRERRSERHVHGFLFSMYFRLDETECVAFTNWNMWTSLFGFANRLSKCFHTRLLFLCLLSIKSWFTFRRDNNRTNIYGSIFDYIVTAFNWMHSSMCFWDNEILPELLNRVARDKWTMVTLCVCVGCP